MYVCMTCMYVVSCKSANIGWRIKNVSNLAEVNQTKYIYILVSKHTCTKIQVDISVFLILTKILSKIMVHVKNRQLLAAITRV